MELENIIEVTTQGLLLCLYLSLPTIVVSAVVGLLVSFIQAVTSLQDQSISHAVKLVAVIVTLIITAPWSASAMLRFANATMAIAFTPS